MQTERRLGEVTVHLGIVRTQPLRIPTWTGKGTDLFGFGHVRIIAIRVHGRSFYGGLRVHGCNLL